MSVTVIQAGPFVSHGRRSAWAVDAIGGGPENPWWFVLAVLVAMAACICCR